RVSGPEHDDVPAAVGAFLDDEATASVDLRIGRRALRHREGLRPGQRGAAGHDGPDLVAVDDHGARRAAGDAAGKSLRALHAALSLNPGGTGNSLRSLRALWTRRTGCARRAGGTGSAGRASGTSRASGSLRT